MCLLPKWLLVQATCKVAKLIDLQLESSFTGLFESPLLVVLFEGRHLLILGAVLNHVGPSHIDKSLCSRL